MAGGHLARSPTAGICAPHRPRAPPDIDEHLCWYSDGARVPCTARGLHRKLDCMKVSEALKFIACVLQIRFVGHRWAMQEVEFVDAHWSRRFVGKSWRYNVPREAHLESQSL